MNPYRGEVSLELAGQKRTVRYSWLAVMELRREFGNDFDTKLSEASVSLDLEALARALAIGLRECWPECTADDVVRASPPLVAAVAAVNRAMALAFHGPEGAMERTPENPLRAAARRLCETMWKALRSLRWQPA